MNRIAFLFAAFILVLAGPAAAQSDLATKEYQERVMGDPDAPVTILEYSSLTCGHCANFHADVLPEVKEKYIETGKAKLVFRDFPLDPLAAAAALVARCVPEQNYFPFLETLFAGQENWTRSQEPLKAIQGYARLAGLSAEGLEACLNNEGLFNTIQQVKQEGQQEYGISGTPTLIVNGEVLPAYTALPDALAEAVE
ncbi:Periplasmic thiol disulfide interchange protein DsbA [Caenispirillum salinarum AK4]|uniref:Periplasmic thiol disulfide interchange protein DsbA n=1 Tax=Caenispirillum salinarum AK4 TaxID=1238182 RepID=K9H2X1_9PROT|nr:thioredoxin domain-containing protein [Caenispirillum salinarum]EKV32590.1 Periplasmic thiol disulfide interchange protein DsbA [Caenispirillum salinarum AK4]